MSRLIFIDDFQRGNFNDDMAPGPVGQVQYREDEIMGGGESDWRLEGSMCWPDGPPFLIGGGPAQATARQVVIFDGAGLNFFLNQSTTDPARIMEWEVSCDVTFPTTAIPNNMSCDLVLMAQATTSFERVVMRWRHFVNASPVEFLEFRYHTAASPLTSGFSVGGVGTAQGVPAMVAGATHKMKARMRVHNGGQTMGMKLFIDGTQYGPEFLLNIGTLTTALSFPGNFQAAPKNIGFAAQLEGGNLTGQPAFPPNNRLYFDNLQMVDLINPLAVDDPFPMPTLTQAASPSTKITVAREVDDAGTLPIQPSYARPMDPVFRRGEILYDSGHRAVTSMQEKVRRRWVKTFGPMDQTDATALRDFINDTVKGQGRTYTWVDAETDITRKMRIDAKTATVTVVGRHPTQGRIYLGGWEAIELNT